MNTQIFIPQKKHLMLSVSTDQSCKHGIKFVSNFFHHKKEISITLFYVSPVAPKSDLSYLTEAWESDAPEEGSQSLPSQIRSTMNFCQNYLMKSGFPEANIQKKSSSKKTTTIKDLICSAESCMSDALVLGKRNSSFLEEAISESVSKGILDMNFDFPLWICREPDETRKNVLLCVDGSDSSLRAADHVGYMLNDQIEHTITMFNIDNGHGLNREKIFSAIHGRLNDCGIADERIFQKTKKSIRVTKSINDEIDKNKYAVAAFGWTGRTPHDIKSFFAGSKSRDLIKDLTKTALWVIK